METKRQMLHKAVILVVFGHMDLYINYGKVISFFNNLPAVGVKRMLYMLPRVRILHHCVWI